MYLSLPPFWSSWLAWPKPPPAPDASGVFSSFLDVSRRQARRLAQPAELRIDVDPPDATIEQELSALHQRLHSPGDALHGLPSTPLPGHPGLCVRSRVADGELYVYIEDPLRQCRSLRYWRDLWHWPVQAPLLANPWPLLQIWGTEDALVPAQAYERFARQAQGRAAPYCARALPGADHGLQAPGRDGLQQVWAWLEQWAREPAAGLCAPLQRHGDSRVSIKPGDGGSRTPPV